MQEQVYRTMNVLCSMVEQLPIGTNLGMLHLLWMMLSGQLLKTRGAVIPGLDALGLPAEAVRRGWAALGQGAWDTSDMVSSWERLVRQEGQWQPHCHGGWRPVAADTTAFLRPRLANCPTKHYLGKTGHAVPAIPFGLIVRVGQVGSQRLGLPVAIVRAPEADPSPQAQDRAIVRQVSRLLQENEVAILDRGFHVSMLQKEGCSSYVVRLAKNFTARRAALPDYKGKGRRPKRGETVRPLARVRKDKFQPATPPDRVESWSEGEVTLRAEWWDKLVLPQAKPDSPTFQVAAVYDPRYEGPLLLATPLALTGADVRALYLDRWPVEQVPLTAKQMIGAHRQFVHARETRQRLPELALLAGSMLSYLAAGLPAVSTGFWDRKPQPTSGRLRRVLGKVSFPECYVPLGSIRKKGSVTGHLPKGYFGQCGKSTAVSPALVA